VSAAGWTQTAPSAKAEAVEYMGSHMCPSAAEHTEVGERFVFDALRRLVRTLREASRLAEQRFGLSAAQVFVLQQLGAGEGLSINELAARTLTHQSSVSVVVSRLLAARLVNRAAAADDARRVEVRLTSKGRALLKRAPVAAQARLVEGLRKMTPRDRDALCMGLGAWLEAIGLSAEEPPMFFEEAPRTSGSPKRSKRRARRA
jgi:MarR family transcriptional regulator, lower aerobic nicotinate degradation pathway regulator